MKSASAIWRREEAMQWNPVMESNWRRVLLQPILTLSIHGRLARWHVYRLLCSQQVVELIDSINPECFFISYAGNKSNAHGSDVTTAVRMQIDRCALACMVIWSIRSSPLDISLRDHWDPMQKFQNQRVQVQRICPNRSILFTQMQIQMCHYQRRACTTS